MKIEKSTAHRSTHMKLVLALAASTLLLISTPSALLAEPTGKIFASPEEAAKALVEAGKSDTPGAFLEVFGADAKSLVSSGDEVLDKQRVDNFKKRLMKVVAVTKQGETAATVRIGEESWPFPIPLAKGEKGWYFDVAAGSEEILNRFIGENEIRTMKALESLVAAEGQYAAKDRDNDGVLEYAQKLISTEGTHDGLYWPREAGKQASPLGELAVEASEEGNTAENIRGAGFHGYRYRLLTKQGEKAAGGAYDYLANGNLVGGFAAVAYPAEYGKSGVMTFVVNRNGKIYQKDLGPETEKFATSMESYDPDETWTAQ